MAVRHVLSGQVHLSPKMTQRFLNRSAGQDSSNARDSIDRLTNRKLEVFRLIGDGLSTRCIADKLCLSVHTVESHRENIKKKPGLRSGTELNQRAVQSMLDNG